VIGPVIIGTGLLALATVIGMTLLIMVHFGVAAARLDRALAELTNGRVDQPLERRLEHRANLRALKNQCGVPIERLGYDLRRLRVLVRGSEHCSATQQLALLQAYDQVLVETCVMLEVENDLDRPTAGMERDIERLRVEATLEACGIVLSDPHRRGQNADH
jgi:hypothetical protein